VLFGGAALGCVKKSEFEAKQAELARCIGFQGKCQKDLQASQVFAELSEKKASTLQSDFAARTAQANKDLAELQKQLDDATALSAGLRAELERKGEDVDKLLKEKGAMATSLEQLKARLEELRRAQAAAERRAESMRQLVDRFRKMADAGQLQVTVRNGRMVVQLPNDVLFDSGRAAVKSEGKATIAELAAVLKAISNRQFQVAGHTDNEPIRSSNYPSNWYLSTARAIKVVELLIDGGVDAKNLSACGYGEFDPVTANDTDGNKAKNRRIEIVIQPNVDELLTVGTAPGW
jgi:chemotaxis protein MotB